MKSFGKKMVNGSPTFANRLHTRLTLSYIAVTILTLLILFLAYLVIAAMQFAMGFSNPRGMLYETEVYRPALASFWHEGRLDSDGLQSSLDRFRPYVERQSPSQVEIKLRVAVTDDTGIVLASSPKSAFEVGIPLAKQIPNGDQKLHQAALRGEERPGRLTRGTGKNQATIAGPIKDQDEKALGTLHVMIEGRLLPGMFSRLFLELLPIMGIVLLGGFIVCVVLGTGISSRILSRFQTLSNAASAWTRGDFSHRAPTSPNDELGQLSASLNAMANEMNDLLKEREQRAFVEERDRLARDLHDTVKQHTFAAAMQLATAQKLMSEDQPATPHVISAISLVEQARQDLAAMLLRSVNSVEIPLDKALAQRIESWSSQSGIDCQVDLLPVSMSEKVKNHTVLRIIDEALANVLRHSQARSVKVTLAVINGVTCLEIIDDGVGFDKKSVTPGMGLENLERRSKELPSGQLCITSSQGHGCQVSVNWRSQ